MNSGRLPFLIVAAVAAALWVGLAGCGDEDGPAAPRVQTTVTVSATDIDFGATCTSAERSFKLKAPETNTAEASGSVGLDGCSAFSITAGGGDYTLAPGDSLLVAVKFHGANSGPQSCTVQTGAANDVRVRGEGRVYAYLEIEPVNNTTFRWKSNYFMDAPTVTLNSTTVEDPSWSQCGKGFRVKGSPVEENGVTIGNLRVPGSTSRIVIIAPRDAESGCNQDECLVQLDGNREYYFTAPLVCSGGSMNVNWPFSSTGTRSIKIGLDQSDNVLCFDDVVYSYFIIRFEGVCVPAANAPMAVAGGELDAPVYGGEGTLAFADTVEE